MKYSYKLSDAIHILVYIYIAPQGLLDSQTIAASIGANPSVVRRLMATLKHTGLIISHAGAAEPRLACDPHDITLLEVARAVEPGQMLYHVDPRTNADCPVGAHIQQTLDAAYTRIQRAAEAEMRQLTVADMIQDVQDRHQQVS
ncbi:MAG: Rrf2 family transcriptional regulator [Levilactobacillus sp.]|jgi:DNA-binding IscR family transcriptional regulator|uniref:Rrf2 family transcriptional regulator n=1 Tax=Levilactobacillus suantsaiihabitans TaxID=2487722 RepID=A0A4Z0J8R0_9LACO|nr:MULTISPECIES: Rrf2 family transcriptional regulator [Levilactobacillus]MCI1554310.1 Rrf2 family transcriptional regulator [Levilactobacillus sp.]MCI1598581.1 Rrf2 family transcriptional regulator [Levilactobacillus sp.]MCI1606267.1 Rrf2 family transcriptional regulator [Levilactobacillus sp.]TGD18369.1 Rrf2 family transcriptional regulator [Levilactobacillus suantsaiihabitans]